MSKANDSIKCSISNCKHFHNSNSCKLDSISIGGDANSSHSKYTQCTSFQVDK